MSATEVAGILQPSEEIEKEAAKRKFHFLDFLRGVAAIIVMQRHTGLTFDQHVNATFLAVDLFFLMSGFVIAHSYEDKFYSRLSFGRFISLRLIRLEPLYLLALLIGLGSVLAKRCIGLDSQPADFVFQSTLIAILFIPPMWFLPLSTPRWSLTYEVLANMLHAFFYRQMSTLVLLLIILMSSAILLYLLATGKKIDGGWGVDGFGVGLCRVGFSYFMGVYLSRVVRKSRKVKLSDHSSMCIHASRNQLHVDKLDIGW